MLHTRSSSNPMEVVAQSKLTLQTMTFRAFEPSKAATFIGMKDSPCAPNTCTDNHVFAIFKFQSRCATTLLRGCSFFVRSSLISRFSEKLFSARERPIREGRKTHGVMLSSSAADLSRPTKNSTSNNSINHRTSTRCNTTNREIIICATKPI
jgi:hypothetical protein